MTPRRKSEGFNLAFIDIMSCGLGAVVLVFMLVKHNVNDSSIEIENLKNDIAALEISKQEAMQSLNDAQQSVAAEMAKKQDRQTQLENIKAILARQQASVEQTATQVEELKSSIKGIKVEKKADLVEAPVVYEENYLLGLKVEGNRIAILMDASASMTDEKLIDIIKTKSGPAADKKQAPKWLRTKNVVQWLLARAPANSEVMVVAFNEQATTLGQPGWQQASDSNVIPAIINDMNKLVPEGATNLQLGLQAINDKSPSNVYIVTDGLPTKGQSRYKSLNPFASCGSLTGTAQTISGECRVKLFRQTVNDSNVPGAVINTVLLPIEGDPDAINEYWNWTAATGGLLISPASNWP